MLTAKFTYVGHSKGEYEGTKYDNIKLSDGIAIISFKNETGLDSFLEKGFIPEKSQVNATIKIRSKKETAMVSLTSIELLK